MPESYWRKGMKFIETALTLLLIRKNYNS